MFDLLRSVIPYISGFYTLPWIIVGFVLTWLLSRLFSPERVDATMKRIGLVLLYFFVAPLVFRFFLDTPLGIMEAEFVLVVIFSLGCLYGTAYLYAMRQIRKQGLEGAKRSLYLKTVLTNQGRSSAFVGGIMFVVNAWAVPTAIYIAISGIALFAVIPYILHLMNARERRNLESEVHLPWFLRIYPFYFITFVLSGVILQKTVGIKTSDLGDWGLLLRFYTTLTIPAALYYVGSGIHPRDMKKSELRKLVGIDQEDGEDHWLWVRQIFMLTAVWTPLIYGSLLGVLLALKVIPTQWFAVLVINTMLPITGTNMFLVPYGIDKRATAHAITWSTLICVPVVVALIWFFSFYFG
ncbi:MAG: hypothetical protein Q8M98_10820 [Candidatus Cloacimonadaceae bacterium]|nr:hypothetical protein [Candidatus Cloacimonadaceae bacterium]MDP3115247.1 hypothetical protein [Candidatus Cloacimonadaceae bacterium]